VIDTHCHLLPRLDDGPRSPEEAVELARELVQAGVTSIVCTPHFTRRYRTAHAEAVIQLKIMRDALAAAEIQLELALAAEIGPNAALEADEADLRARAIAERFLLVELEPGTPAAFLSLCADRMDSLGLVPVFAHPERCRAVQRDPSAIGEARARGAVVQVVATSLGGAWGSTVSHAAWAFVAAGRADIVASDSHRPRRTREALRPVLDALLDKLGTAETHRLTELAPAQICQGELP
jgi:protein-tyrosine phosphatase